MTFAFHAAAPPGEWVNDPNGLVFADGRYRLFVQHSAAAPDYKAIGWARLSSDDLLQWQWDGPVIPPDATGLAYSGSVTATRGSLTAWLTRHAPPVQRQYRLTSGDAGQSWRQEPDALGPDGRNVRDPFVFRCAATGDRRMIVAEPCDWTGWPHEPASRLSVWREDGACWTCAGTIGPWSPAGVMWEVPVLIDFGTDQVLVVSMVDRRDGGAVCSVRYWVGRFDGRAFAASDPDQGRLLDHGPDFYATCLNTATGWPSDERLMVGWASTWATARTMAWPAGLRGGPISLPRRLSLVDGCLTQQPLATALPLATRRFWAPGDAIELVVAGDDAQFRLRILGDGTLKADRVGHDPALNWAAHTPDFVVEATEILVFADQGLIEIFFIAPGKTLTVFIPGGVLQEG